jgi:hypothetical protein
MLYFITRGRALALGDIISIGRVEASFAQQSPAIGTTVISGLDSPRGLHALTGGDAIGDPPTAPAERQGHGRDVLFDRAMKE